MAHKTLNFAQWIWQDYVGASWEQLSKGNTWGGDDATYCYLKGSDSKSNYRPKSVFYHYQMDGIDSSKYQITDIQFTVIFGRKTNTKTNALPSLKVFYGDNNAPYKKEPLYTTSTYTLGDNYYDFDTYTVTYSINNVTIAQLKNIICELDWKRSKTTSDSAVSINRAYIRVYYKEKNPKFSLYNILNKYSAKTNETISWKLTVKNTGECGSGSVYIDLPKGMSVASSSGDGTYNNSTRTWSFKNLCKNKEVTRIFRLKSTTVGLKYISARNDSPYAVNKTIAREVTWVKYIPTPTVNVGTPKDKISYVFYETRERENNQFFDVNIRGYKENHPFGGACYRITSSENVDLKTPLRAYVEFLDGTNIQEIVRDSTVTYDDITITLDDNTVCFKLNDKEQDFVANIRVYMYCTDDTQGTIYTDPNSETVETITNDTFDILPMRGNIFNINEDVSRDKQYVMNSINVGVPNIWTIRAKSHRHNFFDDRKDLMEVELEQMIAYIGVIPLSRCHKADVTATSKNTLIENRYLNRAYYGKKGDYSEDIKMTLRMKWQDVATLQGLCEMDKPIPIDTIPYFPDGDPLNHRGWAEIHEVSNIKKINDMLYECDVGVTYLTHNILTRFTISEAKKITEASIKYYLSLIHDYNQDLLDIWQLNFYQFWSTLEDVNGDKVGSYEIDPNASLIMNRDLNKFSTYDVVWRNTLPVLKSEDYDGNWEMYLRIKDKDAQRTLFEHSYTNYKHYDFDTQYAVNTADTDTVYWTGNGYETINHERISLGFDDLAPLIEDRKIVTHFNTMEDTVIDTYGEQFEIFLLDSDNKALSDKTVKVRIEDEDGFTTGFYKSTDIWGRVLFDMNYGNGEYTISLIFDEDESYRGCSYTAKVTVELDDIVYHFEYPRDVTVLSSDYEYTFQLLDENNDGVSDIMLHYSFKTLGGGYGYERTVTTDANGYATIPIDFVNGTVVLKVALKGFEYQSSIYQPVMFEEEVNINVR